jgi:hypothetical protein
MVLYAYVCVCEFSLRRESPGRILGDKPLLFHRGSVTIFKMGFELKNSRSAFDFRKLIKIVRNRLKIQEFVWRYEIQFITLFMLVTSSKSPLILN